MDVMYVIVVMDVIVALAVIINATQLVTRVVKTVHTNAPMVVLGKGFEAINMITIEKIADRIGISNNGNELVYLGKKSGIPQSELLDGNNNVFFDTNNINKYVTINDYNNIEETEVSFINDARFYTCKQNGQNSLCFRCYNGCTECNNSCQQCADCYSCNACNDCNDCNDCNSCNACNDCNGCNICYNCFVYGYGECHECYSNGGCYNKCVHCVSRQ